VVDSFTVYLLWRGGLLERCGLALELTLKILPFSTTFYATLYFDNFIFRGMLHFEFTYESL
jgi:hypothetical protein